MVVIYIYLFIVGLFFGSFYNCIADRLSNGLSIIRPGSHCENCKHRLAWYELIPVFSFIFLKGKCKNCKTKISPVNLIVEIITGILLASSFYGFGFSYNTLIMIILSSLLIIIFITDMKYMIILDEVLITALIILSVFIILQFGFIGYLKHLLSGLIVLLIMLITKFLGDRAFKQESLGWGDVKLSFIAGLVLGTKLGIIYIFLGSFLALPYALIMSIKKKDNVLPFGPFLALSMFILFRFSSFFINVLNVLMGVHL